MSTVKDMLAYTNPLALTAGVGIFLAIILKNMFSGVAKDCVKIAKKI